MSRWLLRPGGRGLAGHRLQAVRLQCAVASLSNRVSAYTAPRSRTRNRCRSPRQRLDLIITQGGQSARGPGEALGHAKPQLGASGFEIATDGCHPDEMQQPLALVNLGRATLLDMKAAAVGRTQARRDASAGGKSGPLSPAHEFSAIVSASLLVRGCTRSYKAKRSPKKPQTLHSQ